MRGKASLDCPSMIVLRMNFDQSADFSSSRVALNSTLEFLPLVVIVVVFVNATVVVTMLVDASALVVVLVCAAVVVARSVSLVRVVVIPVK